MLPLPKIKAVVNSITTQHLVDYFCIYVSIKQISAEKVFLVVYVSD